MGLAADCNSIASSMIEAEFYWALQFTSHQLFSCENKTLAGSCQAVDDSLTWKASSVIPCAKMALAHPCL